MSARLSTGNFTNSIRADDQNGKGEVLLIGMQFQYYLRMFDQVG